MFMRVVRHRRRNQFAAVAAVVLLGAIGLVAVLADDEQVVDSVGPVEDGAVTVDELAADRWVAFAYSAVIVAPSPPPFLEFGDDGRLGGIDGCRPIDGSWELDRERLVTSLEPTEDVPCAEGTGGLVELLESDPAAGRFDGDPDTLQLTSGDDFIAFQRFDRLGDVPSAASLDGMWVPGTGSADDGGSVAFATDGTGRIEILGCSQPFEWSLDDDVLDVDGLERNGVPCDEGVAGGGLLLTLTAEPRLRAHGSSLWLSSDFGVDVLRSDDSGPDPTSTSTSRPDEDTGEDALEQAARSIRFVSAAPDGVTLHDGGGQPTRVADGDAAVAFAIGTELVVHQPASTQFAEFPPTPQGAPVVWDAGSQQELPVDPDARSVRLLDAAVRDGAPVALIAESYGGVGPEDTFEELVLVDLETLDRTTVVRRPSWESGHFDARMLPDGDVIGLLSSESLVLLARWRLAEDDPAWTVEVATDRRPTLTVVDGQVRVIDAGFDEDLQPTLAIRRFGTDGTDQDDEEITIADPDGELGAGFSCTDWHDDVHLLCGRSDGPPIVASLDSRSFEQLPAAAGGLPSGIRPR